MSIEEEIAKSVNRRYKDEKLNAKDLPRLFDEEIEKIKRVSRSVIIRSEVVRLATRERLKALQEERHSL